MNPDYKFRQGAGQNWRPSMADYRVARAVADLARRAGADERMKAAADKRARRRARLLALAAAGAIAVAAPANAQTIPGLPLVVLGYCQLSPTASTALSSCSGGIPALANAVVVRTEGQPVRYRDDGTAPTATVGQPILVADPPLFYQGNLAALRFIQTASSATLDVLFYKASQ
jgi:hypothetical protein